VVVYGYRRTKSGSLEEVLDTNGANGMTMVSPIHDGSCCT